MLAGTVLLVAVMVPLAAVGVVGTLIASRQPSNPIGWTLCGIALWGATVEVGRPTVTSRPSAGFPAVPPGSG
jgi:hypothetical protein